MTCADCTPHLHDYVDGELAAADAHGVETHLAGCPACRAELAALQALLAHARALPGSIAPERNLWLELRAELERPASRSFRAATLAPLLRWAIPLAAAAAIVLLATLPGRRPPPRHGSENGPAWSVATLAGAPRVDARRVSGAAPFRRGQWLETDGVSRAKVVVGAIGEVTVAPNSRLRLANVADADHRLQLQRGSLSALIWAMPRIFFVDTPSATAVDLGCAYTLHVADNGDGELRVTLGYVALQNGGRESLIPERAMCLTRRGAGPGTPFNEDAPSLLRAALVRFDFEPGAAAAALPGVLHEARPADAITLWHLLTRTRGAERARVFERLAELRGVPAGVTRSGILQGDGDAAMRRAWANHLGFETFGLR